ncbi:hypothetical protein E3P81_03047 [Wallemia ichthyophaga]|nr:hypothetical protein E3P97_03172 [Wallemia ichthyophaga]TIA99640.1 hypothetical protein E3P96_02867 [Wallemia ichthyophaga]TIB27986.1 hypothetical protein E3P85_03930 [Wallemia ichthyophaga]TIB45072.1 hypothetical protein E3P82_03107 [Wallemia ichthyophaga]TIB48102.1 hypothetical protein E3P81_03047 [Wallemia ichthyophaga]
MFTKYFGRGYSVARNTLQFAYTQITQSPDDQPAEINRETEHQDNDFERGSVDSNSQADSVTHTIRAGNRKNLRANPQIESGPSAMPGETNDVEYTYRPQFAINESEELVNVKYTTLIWLHIVTPISLLVHFSILAGIILHAFPTHFNPFIPIFIGVSAWIVAQSLKQPIYQFVAAVSNSRKLQNSINTVIHTFALDLVRWQSLLIAVPDIRENRGNHSSSSFTSLSWFTFGWIAVSLTFSTFQEFRNLALYKDLLPIQKPLLPMVDNESEYSTETASSATQEPDDLEHQLITLHSMRDRCTLSATYGQPFPNIPLPGFLFPLWRLDTLLLGSGVTLILGARPNWITYLTVALINTVHSFIWQLLLPKFGLGGLTWISFMFATIIFFIGLDQFGIV